MGGCSSNIVTQLIKNYGRQKIIDYATSVIGGRFLENKFLNIKSLITEKFNMANKSQQSGISGMNYDQKTSIFDKIIGKVLNTESEEIGKMRKMKPNIPELDDENNVDQKKKFLDIINKDYAH